MTLSSLRLWLRAHESLAIVAVAVALVSSLFAVEILAGIPASVRGTAIYNSLPMPKAKKTVRAQRVPMHGAAQRAKIRRVQRMQSASSSAKAL